GDRGACGDGGPALRRDAHRRGLWGRLCHRVLLSGRTRWIIVDDPQSLGEALMLGALVSYIARPPDRLSLLRTAFLVVLGSFIKHNLVAIPIAITLDLTFRSPRRLSFWVTSCAGFAAGFLGLTQIVAGGDF